jgi:hypothetical protein
MQIPSLCYDKNETELAADINDDEDKSAEQPISLSQNPNEHCDPIPPQMIPPSLFNNLTANMTGATNETTEAAAEDSSETTTEDTDSSDT